MSDAHEHNHEVAALGEGQGVLHSHLHEHSDGTVHNHFHRHPGGDEPHSHEHGDAPRLILDA
jgi:hypothetical protein